MAKFQKQIALNSQHASAIGRGSKKGDVYRLGVVLLSLSQGRSVTDLVVDLPTNIPKDFHDFLSKCLIRDERSRWSVMQLREHSFVKAPLVSTIGVSVKASGDGPDRKQAGISIYLTHIYIKAIFKHDYQCKLWIWRPLLRPVWSLSQGPPNYNINYY